MRREFVREKSFGDAMDAAPWGRAFMEVEGGWMVFETIEDQELWEAQQ